MLRTFVVLPVYYKLILKILRMKLEDLEIYNLSMDLADKVYHVIEIFSVFQRDTLGKLNQKKMIINNN